jgi:hypothetical protein
LHYNTPHYEQRKDKIKKSSPYNFEQKNSQPILFSLSDFGNKKVEV